MENKMNGKIWKFQEEKNAKSFWNRMEKGHVIVLGDDGKFWVVTFAQFAELEAAGYEAI
jgi:hypothetical protein